MTTKRGTSIIEIIIAAALISVAVIAALSLTNHSQKQNTYARDSAEATKYTTQAADWIRTQRDTLGWATVADKVVTDGSNSIYCLNTFPSGSDDFTTVAKGACTQGDYIPDTLFNRYLLIDSSDQANGVLNITITVSWMEQVVRESTIEMELTSWR